jgi:hypothetical protein
MTTTTEKAAVALALLPEEMREPAVAHLVEQAENFACSRSLLPRAWTMFKAGRVVEWNFQEFLLDARRPK